MTHRYRTLAILASLTLVGTAYGCSSSSSGDDSSATPDGGGGGGTGADGGGGGTGDSGGGTGTGSNDYQGTVTLSPQTAAGVFEKTVNVTAAAACVTTSAGGSCKLFNCNVGEDAGNVPTYSAGDITLTGGKLSSPVVIHYDSDAGVYGSALTSAPFGTGDTLTVSAAGADVAAFTGTTGKGPSEITLTAPTGTGTAGFQDYSIDTSKDLTVTWTGAAAGTQVAVTLSNTDDPDTNLALICTFDGPGGTGTIPAASMTALGDPSTGILEVVPLSQTTASGSNASVTLQLVAKCVTGSWTKP